MSQVYTPTATPHGSYTLPSDGDPAVAESVNDALRDLADNALVAQEDAADALALANQMINGVTGGSYAPAAAITLTSGGIVLNGSGADLLVQGLSTIEVLGLLTANTGLLAVSGTANFSGAVTMSGSDPLAVSKPTTIDSLTVGNLVVNGDIALGNSGSDQLVVEATTEFEGGITFSSSAVFDGASTFNGSVTLTGDGTFGTNSSDLFDFIGRVRIARRLEYQNSGSGVGRVPYREPVLLPDSSATLSIEDGELFVIRPGITATRTYSISTSGASHGDRMIFTTGADQGLSSNADIAGAQTVAFVTGDRICFAEFVYLEGFADRADGWWPITRAEK